MEKIENPDLEKEILRLHSDFHNKRKVARVLGISTSYVARIILEKEKPRRTLTPDEGFVIVARCKKTNKSFEDYENKSGIITQHITSLFPEFVLPSPFKRRKFFKENNRFWYEDFFEIIQVPSLRAETKKCKFCDWNTSDLENKSGCYTTHLSKIHGKTIDEYVSEYPEEKALFKTHFEKLEKRKVMLSCKQNFIECRICGEKMSKITNTHLWAKHKISLFEYRASYESTLSDSSLDKFRKLYDNNLKELPNTFISKPQAEISEFIKNLGFSVETNNKSLLSGTELDLIVLDKNIAIEFNGLFFHSEKSGKKDRLYHKKKTELAKSKDIRLIHIFEDEWQNKKEIIKSKISHILGVNSGRKIHARKLKLRLITKQEKESFLNSNHIQGSDDSSIFIGALEGETLCAVMTFDNKRSMNREKDHSMDVFELKRFATDIKMIIPGVASRLLRFFIANFKPKKIISFADARWSAESGNLYDVLGFSFDKVLPPDYSYTFYKSGKAYRFHKFGYGKNSIKRKFPDVYDCNKTEWEMMQEKGFDRIWDCGKIKYLMQI